MLIEDKGTVPAEGLEIYRHPRQEVVALEGALDRRAAAPHSCESRSGIDLEEQDQIGDRELVLARGEQLLRVVAARALVGDGRYVVAVGDDDATVAERGLDHLAHVFAPVLEKEPQLLVGVDGRVAARHRADRAPRAAVGGLAGDDRFDAGRAQRVREVRNLGALARAVDSLEGDQCPARHR